MMRAGKKINVLILLLFSVLMVTAQEINQTDEQGRKQGVWKAYFENGNLRYEGTFRDDVPIGLFKHYYKKGGLKMTANYFEKGKSAAAHMYHPNGKTMAKGLYDDQKKDSLWTYYNEDEVLVSEEFYIDGVKHGEHKNYYGSGQLAEVIHYDHGVKDGAWLKYFEDGTLMQKSGYVDGKRHGEHILYQEDGDPHIEGAYDMDLKTGTWFYYLPRGAIEKVERYKDGRLTSTQIMNGEIRKTYPSGIPKSVVSVKNGKKQGVWKEFYDVGEYVEERIPPREGFPEEYREVLKGQQIKTKGYYVNDQLHGEVTHYNLDGSIDYVEHYEEGKLVDQ